MVNPGRVACIFTPFALSVACLVCLILVFLGGTSENNNTLGSYYFLKINLTDFTLSSALDTTGSSEVNTALENALQAVKQDLDLKDIYTIYLWNYCAWTGDDAYQYCSPRQTEFWFDPITAWNLNSTGLDVDTVLPKELKDGLHDYQVVSKFMFIFYVISFVCTCLTLLVGISALFSRWGSFFTTFFASAAAIFVVASSIIATALFVTLDGVINSTLKDYDVHASIGGPMLRATWFAVFFALAAGFFWLLSVCCCSGRSPYHKDQYLRRGESRRIRVEKTPYTYERVGSPYLGPRDGSQAVPLRDLNSGGSGMNFGGASPAHIGGKRETAYEPFRAAQA